MQPRVDRMSLLTTVLSGARRRRGPRGDFARMNIVHVITHRRPRRPMIVPTSPSRVDPHSSSSPPPTPPSPSPSSSSSSGTVAAGAPVTFGNSHTNETDARTLRLFRVPHPYFSVVRQTHRLRERRVREAPLRLPAHARQCSGTSPPPLACPSPFRRKTSAVSHRVVGAYRNKSLSSSFENELGPLAAPRPSAALEIPEAAFAAYPMASATSPLSICRWKIFSSSVPRGEQPVDGDWFFLSLAPHARERLQIVGRVPVRVEEHESIRADEVEPHAPPYS